MKLFRGLFVIGALALSTTALFADSVQVGAPAPGAGESVCVPVSCDGQAAGSVCGSTTQELVDKAVALCDAT